MKLNYDFNFRSKNLLKCPNGMRKHFVQKILSILEVFIVEVVNILKKILKRY